MSGSKSVIRKGDTVKVIAGREKGKTGKVFAVFRGTNRLVVDKLNVVKRHTRPSQKNPQGGILEKEASLHLSNILLLCPKCDTGVRVGVKFDSQGKRQRICKKCSGQL